MPIKQSGRHRGTVHIAALDDCLAFVGDGHALDHRGIRKLGLRVDAQPAATAADLAAVATARDAAPCLSELVSWGETETTVALIPKLHTGKRVVLGGAIRLAGFHRHTSASEAGTIERAPSGAVVCTTLILPGRK